MISRARITALAKGDSWLHTGTYILLFEPPRVGKSPLASALAMP